ncbi:MAG: redox-sensing transcriptional repressor Rex [Deltaproteobacteria bacterium]|jgi:redox-sensing transcriptional repressor|nr:redox-sensing transcriptional repressor Rex [Deltaproteobacteria bacterium]
MKKRKVSARSVERLSIYRRALLHGLQEYGASVYSHEIAHSCQLTAAQVRRDLMAIGYSGNPNSGYNVKRLLASLAAFLDCHNSCAVAIVGMGYLGRAIAAHLTGRPSKIRLTAAFDVDLDKIGLTFSGVRCHSVRHMPEVLADKHIEIALITVPAEQAQHVAEQLVAAGVVGILNFAPVVLRLHERIYVENIDMIVSLEKVAFFARAGQRRKAR